MKRSNLMHFAWWNTKLSPTRQPKEQTDSQWQVASTVVNQLLSDVSADLIALGEVTPSDIERLHAYCSRKWPLRTLIDSRPPGSRLKLGLLYNQERLQILDHKFLEDTYSGQRRASGLRITIKPAISESLLHVFIIHWPSRITFESSHLRESLGHSLQSRIDSLRNSLAEGAPVIVLGDFNDEPFDRSMSMALLGSRDRRLVRKNPSRLYNPFWRLMGEQKRFSSDAQTPSAPGTYFFPKNLSTHWYTFDQILVSAEFISDSQWTLIEEATLIWQAPPLLTEAGRLAKNFDHFPVTSAIYYNPSNSND